MKTIGIIAEYNPFHRGHEYQIRRLREEFKAEYIVVVMSGDFVQRGTPAWTDKFLRTKIALAGGADLVFELPVHYAAASAEGFAMGAVSLLGSLGFVDALCFGSECADLKALWQIAKALAAETNDTRTEYADSPMISEKITQAINEGMKQGCSYPAVREFVLRRQFPSLFRKYPTLLSEPNNILAIEYLKALQQLKSSLHPITIARKDAPYHDKSIGNCICSADAIRNYYRQNGVVAAGAVPDYVYKLLETHSCRFPVTEDDFSALLYYRLRNMRESDYHILDMTPELYRRIQNNLSAYQDASSFIDHISSKNYTRSRIRRVLLHLLLEIHPCTSSAPYARLLGFRRESSHLLRGKNGIPIITKPADAKRLLREQDALLQWDADIRAHDLYRYILNHKYPDACLPDDYHADICIL